MKQTPKPSQEDNAKIADGAARRGEERANGPRDATRATPETRDTAKPKSNSGEGADRKSTRGERPGNQEWDSGGGDVSRGG